MLECDHGPCLPTPLPRRQRRDHPEMPPDESQPEHRHPICAPQLQPEAFFCERVFAGGNREGVNTINSPTSSVQHATNRNGESIRVAVIPHTGSRFIDYFLHQTCFEPKCDVPTIDILSAVPKASGCCRVPGRRGCQESGLMMQSFDLEIERAEHDHMPVPPQPKALPR